MRSKALTIGKVLVSVPAVIFRAAARFIGSLVADIVCLFMGPMRLYSNIKPAGKQQWIAFGFRVLGLSIYNSIALILNATLGLLYNLVESVFMMYELWTNDQVTMKSLYSVDSQENDEGMKEKENINQNKDKMSPQKVNFKLVAGFIFGVFDIDNKMSNGVAKLCNRITASSIFQTVSKKVIDLINKLFAVTNQSKEKSKIDNNTLEKKPQNNEGKGLNEDNKDIKEAKPYSLDSIFNPMHSFRAK